MKKGEVSVKPLVYFISFILGLIFVCMIGIKNTKALEYENLGNLVDITVLYASPDYTDSPIELPPNQSLYLTEVRNLTYIVENYNFIANTHYQLESQLKGVTLTNANYYEVTDENGNNCLISYEYSILYGDYPRWNFQCPYNTRSVAISISNNNNQYLFDPGNFEWSTAVLSKTNTSITSDSSDADNIINNNNQNTQDIINNNNENTDKIIESNKETQEVIKDQFNSCRDSYNLLNLPNGTYTNNGITTNISNGTINAIGTTTSTYFNLIPNSTYILPKGTYTFSIDESISTNTITLALYGTSWSNFLISKNSKSTTLTLTEDKTIVSLTCSGVASGTAINFTIKPMLQKGSVATDYEPYGEKICTNKIDETNDKLDNLTGAITDESIPDVSKLGDTVGVLPPGPVDSILTLPLTMLNNLMTNLNGTCNEVKVELPYVKKNITLPCIKSLYDKMGVTGTIFTSVGLIASAFILFNYLLNLYKWVDDTLTLRENTMPGYFEDKWGGGA